MVRVHAFLLIAALFSCGRRAWAASVVVLLAQAGAGSPDAAAVLHRVRGELGADRFTVVVIEPVAPEARARWVEQAGRTRDASLTAGLFVDAAARTAELCLVDTASGRILVRRMEPRSTADDETAESFARHVVELLQSSLVDFASAPPPESVAQAAPARPVTEASAGPAVPFASEPATSRWLAIEGGIAAIGAPDFALVTYSPLLRLTVAALDPLRFRVTGSYFGSEAVVRGQHGQGRLGQGVLFVDALMTFGSHRPIRSTLSLGAGLYHLRFSGSALPPYVDAHDASTAFALSAGAGVEVAVARHTDLGIDAQALIRSPVAELRLGDEQVARVGRPALLTTATVRQWW
jgi:hypothetical protein